MRLLRLDNGPIIETASRWLSAKENYKWLDFGNGVQWLDPVALKIMAQRSIHEIRVFTDEDNAPIGIVGLSNIDRNFKSATPWCVLGDKRQAGAGYTTRAVSKILGLGFKDLGLHTVLAWTLECNHPAIGLLQRLRFRFIGRHRECHRIDGRLVDRLLFDLLAREYEEV